MIRYRNLTGMLETIEIAAGGTFWHIASAPC